MTLLSLIRGNAVNSASPFVFHDGNVLPRATFFAMMYVNAGDFIRKKGFSIVLDQTVNEAYSIITRITG